jgi:hypothetical protein
MGRSRQEISSSGSPIRRVSALPDLNQSAFGGNRDGFRSADGIQLGQDRSHVRLEYRCESSPCTPYAQPLFSSWSKVRPVKVSLGSFAKRFVFGGLASGLSNRRSIASLSASTSMRRRIDIWARMVRPARSLSRWMEPLSDHYLLSGKIRNAMFTITNDVITKPQRGGTEEVRATKYAAK